MSSTITVVALLVHTLAFAALGNSLHPVSLLAWLSPIVSLLAYDALNTPGASWLRQALSALLFISVQAAGSTIAFADSPSSSSPSILDESSAEMAESYKAAAASYSLLWAAITAGAFWGTRLFHARFPDSGLVTLAFPVLYTGTLACLSFFTSTLCFDSVSIAVLDYQPLRLFASFAGGAGVSFLVMLIASNLYLHCKTHGQWNARKQAYWRHTYTILALALLVALLGGLHCFSGLSRETASDRLQVGARF